MKLKYIGLKVDGERAFQAETGIEWMPDSVHEVSDAVAAKMLEHPTIWTRVDNGPALASAAAKAPARNVGTVDDQDVDDAATKAEQSKKEAAGDPLANLDDAAVRAFAKERSLKIQGIGLLKGEKLRAKVTAALGGK